MSMEAHTLAILAAHIETAEPHIPPRQPKQTEQFIDAPPKDMYKHEWRKHVKRKQKEKKQNDK